MDMQFLYENGQGQVVDENGIEPMDLAVNDELFAIETINPCTPFLMNKPPESPSNPVMHPVAEEKFNDAHMELCNKKRYTVYSVEDKSKFFHVFFNKCLKPFGQKRRPSARKCG
ncbi:hypothetical protein BD408DRAFT_411238 [Parasitella parasitica]|nr:hypothetical protein BD408DRAFT_411238 [Parasitella parasitica]